MKTNELIAVLAVDTLPQDKVSSRLLRALPLALVLSLGAFALFWGPRADLADAVSGYAALKTLVPMGVVVLALILAVASVHPAAPQQTARLLLGIVFAVALGVFGVFLARDGQAGLAQALSPPDLWVCLLSIPVLSAPLLGGALWALSSGASLRPGLSGAMAGLVAGGVAASIYSLYCNKDAVLFVLPAYAAAIAVVMFFGAAMGARILKW